MSRRRRAGVLAVVLAVTLAAGACSADTSQVNSVDSAPPTTEGTTTTTSDGKPVPRGPGLGQVVLRAEDATADWVDNPIETKVLEAAQAQSPSCFVDMTDPAVVSEFSAFEMAPRATFNQKVVSFVFTTTDAAAADFATRVESGAVADCLKVGYNTPPETMPGEPAINMGRGIDQVVTAATPELGDGAFTITGSGELPVSLGPDPVPYEQTTVILRKGNTFAVGQFGAAVEPFPLQLRSRMIEALQQRLDAA